jgi:putative phosphoesterase
MKLLVISDSHGHITNLKAVMEIAVKSNIQAVIHCGDWDNISSVQSVLSFGIPLYTVMGNADVESEMGKGLKVKGKGFDEKFLEVKLGGKNIGVVHNFRSLSLSQISTQDIIFSGHLHSKYESSRGPVKIVRPGAILNGINFAIYETETNQVEFISDE